MLLTGDEPILLGETSVARLADFWAWMGSDLLHNAFRGQFAEFLVSRALECQGDTRPGWSEYDLLTSNGVPVEVKSAAYLQSWEQDRLSPVQFSIRPASRWGADGRRETESRRHSQVYVFALLHHKDRATVNPLDLAQWTFHVLSTDCLDRQCPSQKTISLGSLVALEPEICDFFGLKAAVARASGKGG